MLETLAVLVHGSLFGGHALAMVYNHKRGNPKQTLFHAGAAAWEVYATWLHLKEIRNVD